MDAAASAVVKQTEREKGATDGNASVIEGAPPTPARRSPLCHNWTQAAALTALGWGGCGAQCWTMWRRFSRRSSGAFRARPAARPLRRCAWQPPDAAEHAERAVFGAQAALVADGV